MIYKLILKVNPNTHKDHSPHIGESNENVWRKETKFWEDWSKNEAESLEAFSFQGDFSYS